MPCPQAAWSRDRGGRRWALNNQGRVHILLAAHSMGQIEKLYGAVFEGILGERISTRPVEVVNPFPWVAATPTPRAADNRIRFGGSRSGARRNPRDDCIGVLCLTVLRMRETMNHANTSSITSPPLTVTISLRLWCR